MIDEVCEKVVDCETAKLFKELKYNVECRYAYLLDKKGKCIRGPFNTAPKDSDIKLEKFDTLLAPTIDEALDYFIEEYNLMGVVRPSPTHGYLGEIYDITRTVKDEYVIGESNQVLISFRYIATLNDSWNSVIQRMCKLVIDKKKEEI